MWPTRCITELTVTTRDRPEVRSRSSSRPVRAKWPRWLVAIWSSKPSGGLPVRGAHDAGVVDEEVEAGVLGQELLGRPSHRDQVRQVQRQELDGRAVEVVLQLVRRAAGLLRVAAGQDDVGTLVGQGTRRGEPDAAVGAGDEGDPPGLVADVVGAPRRRRHRAAYALPMWSAGIVPRRPAW